jgi:hypothetical protein
MPTSGMTPGVTRRPHTRFIKGMLMGRRVHAGACFRFFERVLVLGCGRLPPVMPRWGRGVPGGKQSGAPLIEDA